MISQIATDETYPAAQLEAGRLLFAQPCTFLKSVVAPSGLPEPDRVEVAFAGRSNVGKSSLINTLTNRKSLARTSNTPGRTRELNFFSLTEQLYLVDMPGYGYARAEKTKIQAWTTLIEQYLNGRVGLRRVYLLIDARHGFKDVDAQVMKLMDASAVSYQVVLTKADKVKKSDWDRLMDSVAAVSAKHVAAHPLIVPTSSRTGAGIDHLRAEITALVQS